MCFHSFEWIFLIDLNIDDGLLVPHVSGVPCSVGPALDPVLVLGLPCLDLCLHLISIHQSVVSVAVVHVKLSAVKSATGLFRDLVRAGKLAQYNDPGTGRLNRMQTDLYDINYAGAFPAMTSHNVCFEKGLLRVIALQCVAAV